MIQAGTVAESSSCAGVGEENRALTAGGRRAGVEVNFSARWASHPMTLKSAAQHLVKSAAKMPHGGHEPWKPRRPPPPSAMPRH